jgi:hypothetical protein
MDIWAIAAAAAAAVSAGISGDAAVRAEKLCEYLQAAPLAHLPLHRSLSLSTIVACKVKHVSESKNMNNKPLQSHEMQAFETFFCSSVSAEKDF